ncbi:MAG: PD40 domain-containing protein [Pyrinomonadaceae bacterium]|nr:PD40 domain-containing protein [Pyrinomonadaceae bacterium]
MKRCPECRKDYIDDSLLYCLDDGTPLVQGSVSDEPATAIFSGVSGDDATKVLNAEGTSSEAKPITLSFPAFLSWRTLPWVVAGIFGLAAIFFGWSYLSGGRTSVGTAAVRLSFEPSSELSFNDSQPDWAVISPDGEKILFSASGADGKNVLFVREINSSEVKPLPGSSEAVEPFWSPDSKSVAFGSSGKLRRSDLAGGNPQVLCDAARLVGGSWGKDGTIIFVPDYRTALLQVSAKGSEPQPVNIQTDDLAKERHSQPAFLADGRHFLFKRAFGTGLAGSGVQQQGIWAGSLDSPEVIQVVPDDSNAVYTSEGYIVYVRNDALVAQAFDASSRKVLGEPVPLIQGQPNAPGNIRRFSVSNNGVLIWQSVWQRDYQLLWFDREGKQLGAVTKPEKVWAGYEPRISPDGKRLAFRRGVPANLWMIDLQTGTDTRITTEFAQFPIWSPDGSKVAFGANAGLSVKDSNGVGDVKAIVSDTTFPYSWSPDGSHIYYVKRGVKTQSDIFKIAVDGDRKLTPLVTGAANERWPQPSPDGRFLAYESDETGTYEIYVAAILPDGTLGPDRKRVSNAGGISAVWRRDGSELFFIAGDGQLTVVTTNTKAAQFEFSPPKALFKTNTIALASHEFDVSLDGQKFIVGTRIGAPTAQQPTVILNWPALMNK